MAGMRVTISATLGYVDSRLCMIPTMAYGDTSDHWRSSHAEGTSRRYSRGRERSPLDYLTPRCPVRVRGASSWFTLKGRSTV
jgi:hypothetical protein